MVKWVAAVQLVAALVACTGVDGTRIKGSEQQVLVAENDQRTEDAAVEGAEDDDDDSSASAIGLKVLGQFNSQGWSLVTDISQGDGVDAAFQTLNLIGGVLSVFPDLEAVGVVMQSVSGLLSTIFGGPSPQQIMQNELKEFAAEIGQELALIVTQLQDLISESMLQSLSNDIQMQVNEQMINLNDALDMRTEALNAAEKCKSAVDFLSLQQTFLEPSTLQQSASLVLAINSTIASLLGQISGWEQQKHMCSNTCSLLTTRSYYYTPLTFPANNNFESISLNSFQMQYSSCSVFGLGQRGDGSASGLVKFPVGANPDNDAPAAGCMARVNAVTACEANWGLASAAYSTLALLHSLQRTLVATITQVLLVTYRTLAVAKAKCGKKCKTPIHNVDSALRVGVHYNKLIYLAQNARPEHRRGPCTVSFVKNRYHYSLEYAGGTGDPAYQFSCATSGFCPAYNELGHDQPQISPCDDPSVYTSACPFNINVAASDQTSDQDFVNEIAQAISTAYTAQELNFSDYGPSLNTSTVSLHGPPSKGSAGGSCGPVVNLYCPNNGCCSSSGKCVDNENAECFASQGCQFGFGYCIDDVKIKLNGTHQVLSTSVEFQADNLTNSASMVWYVNPSTSQIVNQETSKCLQAPTQGWAYRFWRWIRSETGNPTIEPCDPQNQWQKWNASLSRICLLKSTHEACLKAPSTGSGAAELATVSDASDILLTDVGASRITLNNSAWVVEVPVNFTTGNAIQLHTMHRSRDPNQRFVFHDPTSQIMLENTNYCLDVGENPQSQTWVTLQPCTTSASQIWTKNATKGTNYWNLQPKGNTDLCLDVMNGDLYNEQPIWVYTCNSASPVQTWAL